MKVTIFILIGIVVLLGVLSFVIPVKKKTQEISGGMMTVVSVTPAESTSVPLPTGEDVIRTFFNLIGEKRIMDAISMMDATLVPDDATRQSYGVTFDGFSSIVVTSVDPSMKEEWSDVQETYKVELTVTVKPDAENTLWTSGADTRWVTVKKSGERFYIHDIATGP